MSSLGSPRCRVEIFRDPLFFDDNFGKGWTKTSGGTSSVILDGDTATLNKGNQSQCEYEKATGTITVSPNKKIIARVTSVTGTAKIDVYLDGGWVNIWATSSPGVYQTSIASGTNITKIRMVADGGVCTFDYVSICKQNHLVPDLGDLVKELKITTHLLNDGVNTATLSIPNFAGAYNGIIKNGDSILIWLARDDANLGNPEYKEFGGKVINPSNEGNDYGDFFINLECHGYAEEADSPPTLLQQIYTATNGRTIIEDALALCNYTAKHPVATKWFDNAGSSGSTDDRIDSTHSIAYDEEIPLKAIRETLQKAKNPVGIQGFDVYETPSGSLVGHLQNSLDFVSPIASITPRKYRKDEDMHRVRNKVKVYGTPEKSEPTDKDTWTESLTGWTLLEGNDMTLNGADKVMGSYSVDIDASGVATYFARAKKTFSALSAKFPKEFRNLHLSLRSQTDDGIPAVSVEVMIYAPDSSNYFAKRLDGNFDTDFPLGLTFQQTWVEITLPIGTQSEAGYWKKVGSADWGNIQEIYFFMSWNGGPASNPHMRIDKLYFGEKRYSGNAEDAASQASYRVRCKELEVDDALKSDLECQLRAESYINFFKVCVITLSSIEVDGDHRYNPGDRQRIVVTNDALDTYLRITRVVQRVELSIWDSILSLSNEPQLMDSAFVVLKDKIVQLERRTSGVGTGSGTGGGGGEVPPRLGEKSANFIIKYNGTVYEVINGSTGNIDYTNATKSTAVQWALNNLSSGAIFLKSFRKPSGLTHPDGIKIIEWYEDEERIYLTSGLLFNPIGTRVGKLGLFYFDTNDGAYTGYMNTNDAVETYYSLWTIGQIFGFGTYQWKAKFSHPQANVCCIFGLEWHHGRAGDGIIAFQWDGSVYRCFNKYNQNMTETLLSNQNWTTEHTFKIEWSSTQIKFYIDGVLKATHTTNIPQYPMCFFMEPYKDTTNTNLETFLKIRNFEEIVS